MLAKCFITPSYIDLLKNQVFLLEMTLKGIQDRTTPVNKLICDACNGDWRSRFLPLKKMLYRSPIYIPTSAHIWLQRLKVRKASQA